MERSSLYRFHIDRVTIYWTLAHLVAFALAGVVLYVSYVGGYFSAWYISFAVAVLILMTLSVPRGIEVRDKSVVIRCLMDTTEIDVDRIISVRKVSPRKIRWVLPIFGGCGFFGYYGHFFDFRHFRQIVIYATEWRYLVEIIDVYEDYYYVSCRDRDRFIEEIKSKQNIPDA